MAIRFSWTESFRPSTFSWKTVKSLRVAFMSRMIAQAMTGTTHRSTSVSRPLMVAQLTSAMTSISGARTSMRSAMPTICWMALTSLVRRVMREAEEKRSMSVKEKSCTLSNIALRRFAPKPWLAMAESRVPTMPAAMLSRERTSMKPPIFRMWGKPPSPSMPTSMMLLISRGRISAQTTSSATQIGAPTAGLP